MSHSFRVIFFSFRGPSTPPPPVGVTVSSIYFFMVHLSSLPPSLLHWFSLSVSPSMRQAAAVFTCVFLLLPSFALTQRLVLSPSLKKIAISFHCFCLLPCFPVFPSYLSISFHPLPRPPLTALSSSSFALLLHLTSCSTSCVSLVSLRHSIYEV